MTHIIFDAAFLNKTIPHGSLCYTKKSQVVFFLFIFLIQEVKWSMINNLHIKKIPRGWCYIQNLNGGFMFLEETIKRFYYSQHPSSWE